MCVCLQMVVLGGPWTVSQDVDRQFKRVYYDGDQLESLIRHYRPSVSAQVCSLLRGLLCPPDRRLSMQQLLAHPWLNPAPHPSSASVAAAPPVVTTTTTTRTATAMAREEREERKEVEAMGEELLGMLAGHERARLEQWQQEAALQATDEALQVRQLQQEQLRWQEEEEERQRREQLLEQQYFLGQQSLERVAFEEVVAERQRSDQARCARSGGSGALVRVRTCVCAYVVRTSHTRAVQRSTSSAVCPQWALTSCVLAQSLAADAQFAAVANMETSGRSI